MKYQFELKPWIGIEGDSNNYPIYLEFDYVGEKKQNTFMFNYGWMGDETFVYLVKSLWRKNKETRIESFALQFVFNLEQVKHVVLS